MGQHFATCTIATAVNVRVNVRHSVTRAIAEVVHQRWVACKITKAANLRPDASRYVTRVIAGAFNALSGGSRLTTYRLRGSFNTPTFPSNTSDFLGHHERYITRSELVWIMTYWSHISNVGGHHPFSTRQQVSCGNTG